MTMYKWKINSLMMLKIAIGCTVLVFVTVFYGGDIAWRVRGVFGNNKELNIAPNERGIETARATLSFTDIKNGIGGANHRSFVIASLPPGSEILSAYLDVKKAFHVTGDESISANLVGVDDLGAEHILSSGPLGSLGLLRQKSELASEYGMFSLDGSTELRLAVDSGGDLVNLTSGSVDVYVRYIKAIN